MKNLLQTLAVFFLLLACPPIVEKLLTGIVSGRGLFVGMVFVGAFTCWRVIRCRKREIQQQAERRLHRRALFHLNNEKGEVDWRELFWLLLALGCFGFLIISYGISLAAEPIHIDQILTEATEQLFPMVPLNAKELADLQAAAFSVAVLARATADYPVDMDTATRERRASVKRTLQAVHEKLVDVMVMQAGQVIQATRKGGAK